MSKKNTFCTHILQTRQSFAFHNEARFNVKYFQFAFMSAT